jgi:GntR family transcriptional regulator, transcriptional repressor for pyruvate dehydrogenase complex
MQFDPITRRTLSGEVREALHERIRSGELAPGSQLPSERSLCEQFGVARTSVREAIQGLVSLGLIERRGNRSYVAELLPGVGLDDQRKRSVTDIFEVRRLVEVPMAELAACRATDEQRAEVARIARTFKADMSLEQFRAADHRFHEAVAAACGNPSLAELYGKVLDTLFRSTDFDSLLSASQNESVVRRVIRDASKAHKEIASSLVAGDVEAIRKAAEKHLEQVEALMVAQMT